MPSSDFRVVSQRRGAHQKSFYGGGMKTSDENLTSDTNSKQREGTNAKLPPVPLGDVSDPDTKLDEALRETFPASDPVALSFTK
jgi:hypothetical protein